MPITVNGQSYESTINEQSTLQHGTYYISDNIHNYELQRSNTFQFIVTDLDNLRPAGDPSLTPSWQNPQHMLRLSVNSAAVPHFTQDEIAVRRGNSTLYYAGTPSFQEGQFQFTDYIGAQTVDILMAWQALAYNVITQKVGIANDYKKDCYLVEYTPEYGEVVRTWKMYGCWIKGLQEQDFNQEQASDKRFITATIRYDHAEVDMTGVIGSNQELLTL